ncbi:uncharacterized protein F5891DRAFT_961987 [Suillus fuscotomentosus]|uniref:Uncharacterized protein n=1 Tax=Suillus fuscotomentosus TaxID=1912939 RepID=A0AAD4HF34_9AGAM|nr:uncharacterized protein F5891DRAFT_961987 [Suillus fuscotomentosus]KAG1894177.1 hypothetical protein F5891DRAFT_961987 [Suillus fuscotomentosus]
MLGCAYCLRQAINLFVSSADELFGPITSIRCHGWVTKHIPWTAFALKTSDWERMNNTRIIISDANDIQQYFSSEQQPTLWRAIFAMEELQTAWELKSENLQFTLYKEAIERGLTKIGNYYGKFDDKPVYILALVLHPYYKLAYIAMAWGGPEEQAKERATGNPNAKNWHGEALKVVETTMEEYWTTHKALVDSGCATANTIDDNSTVSTVETMESEYDRHRHMLVQQAVHEHNTGWAAELRRYLKDMPDNVSKETDIVQWWAVSLSNMFQHTFYLISHRDIHLSILPLQEL